MIFARIEIERQVSKNLPLCSFRRFKMLWCHTQHWERWIGTTSQTWYFHDFQHRINRMLPGTNLVRARWRENNSFSNFGHTRKLRKQGKIAHYVKNMTFIDATFFDEKRVVQRSRWKCSRNSRNGRGPLVKRVSQTSSNVGPVIKSTGRHVPGCCRALQGFDQDARQRTSRFASWGHWMSLAFSILHALSYSCAVGTVLWLLLWQMHRHF